MTNINLRFEDPRSYGKAFSLGTPAPTLPVSRTAGVWVLSAFRLRVLESMLRGSGVSGSRGLRMTEFEVFKFQGLGLRGDRVYRSGEGLGLLRVAIWGLRFRVVAFSLTKSWRAIVQIWVVLYIRVPFTVLVIRVPCYLGDLNKDPNLGNYPSAGMTIHLSQGCRRLGSHSLHLVGIGGLNNYNRVLGYLYYRYNKEPLKE